MKMLIIVEGGVVQNIVTDGEIDVYLHDKDNMMGDADIALDDFVPYPITSKVKNIDDVITIARMEIEQEQRIQHLQIGASK